MEEEGRPASRAGAKLSAAVERFGLAGIIRGSCALDVGAAHGGFTEVLLRGGAATVTAIDAGHGQMREPLRSDPRVSLHERANFKSLPLRIAPGPFDFFVVDVSFVAARNMLRPVGLRARAGAEGVVLVKPQFELPGKVVPRGGVKESRRLCEFALHRFRKRATRLGFVVLRSMESPVPGGSGDLELLVHLRFEGFPKDVGVPPGHPGTNGPGQGRLRSAGTVVSWQRPALDAGIHASCPIPDEREVQGMRIRRLLLDRVACFDRLDVTFPVGENPHLADTYVFVGPNGTGKSSLLIALAQLFSEQPVGLDARLLGDTSSVSVELDAHRWAAIRRGSSLGDQALTEIAGRRFVVADQLRSDLVYLGSPQASDSSWTFASAAQYHPAQHAKYRFHFAAFAYSGQRSLGEYRLAGIHEQTDAPMAGACSFSRTTADAAKLVQWIANIKAKEALARARGDMDRAQERADSLRRIEQILSEITGNDLRFRLDEDPLDVRAEVGGAAVRLDLLPDGLKSILSWVADLLMRMDRIPWVDDTPVLKREFALFLDEIEVHLHPAWQRKVLPIVQQTFPNAQVFLATHSPFVVASADDAWIYPLRLDGRWSKADDRMHARPGRSYSTVLREVMGLDEEFDMATAKRFEDFYDLKAEVLGGRPDLIAALRSAAAELRALSAETAGIVEPELRDVERRLRRGAAS